MAPPEEDPFDRTERLLSEVQMKLFEMGGMVGEYREMLAGLRERHDEDAVRLARSLPGARYHVATTFVRENWLKVEAELSLLFPKDEEPGSGS